MSKFEELYEKGNIIELLEFARGINTDLAKTWEIDALLLLNLRSLNAQQPALFTFAPLGVVGHLSWLLGTPSWSSSRATAFVAFVLLYKISSTKAAVAVFEVTSFISTLLPQPAIFDNSCNKNFPACSCSLPTQTE